MSILGRIKKLMPFLAICTVFSVLALPANAAMVSNGDLISQARHDTNLTRMITMLDHGDIQNKLISMGINPADAKARIERMNELELAELNQNLERLPAGAGTADTLVTVFIVLVVTDMLGITDVFSFVHSIVK